MKIPKVVYIGSHKIDVEILENPFEKESDDISARFNVKEGKIRIESNLTPEREFTVFIHECIEVINDIFELELEDDHWKMRVLNEEISSIFKQIIKDGD